MTAGSPAYPVTYYGGLGIREVVAHLRRPEGTVKADRFAARPRLKVALAELDG